MLEYLLGLYYRSKACLVFVLAGCLGLAGIELKLSFGLL